MPFGLGFGELIVSLLILLAPVVIGVVAVRLILPSLGRGQISRDEMAQQQVANELQQAQLRIEELEAKVAQIDVKASFTQDLLENGQTGQ
jgi:hypothetical protein